MSEGKILLVDDDQALAEAVQAVLESRGFKVHCLDDGQAALALAEKEEFDVLITDFRMPGLGGMELLDQVKAARPKLPVIMMTAFSTTDRAIEATKKGVYDYLIKPFEMTMLLELVDKAIQSSRVAAKPVSVGQEDVTKDSIIGTSRVMQEVFKDIGKFAAKAITVMIKGETGSGKELIARALYQHSNRAEMPFIAVNCASIPENLIESELFGHERGAFTGAVAKRVGRFEQANGGTIFLDEIGDLPSQTQVKLLRVLQEKVIHRVGGKEEISIDVRIISATHRDLEQMLEKGEFRTDLFFRLNAAVIELPPLRSRREDVPALVNYFLAKYALEFEVDSASLHKDALAFLEKQEWPGNVRQLENVLRRALLEARGFAISKEIIEKSISDSIGHVAEVRPGDSGQSFAAHIEGRLLAASRGELENGAFDSLLMELERELYLKAVELSHGNQTSMAKWIGVSRLTVREKLDKYGLFPKRKSS